ncbi:MAG: hypothetical protein HY093_02470 [Candidatus Liptonbacteria bacterium]|nr:hypothetical protein [Candidatus Liptonbacteria bacterium]
MDFKLDVKEKKLFQKLDTPKKIQNFLETIPINFEKRGETCYSPRKVLKENKAHCFEGAVLAAAALMFHGERPLLLHLKTISGDYDHVVTPFKISNFWGALSKTNHAVLRYREPVYKNIRELALSYFHEYFLDNGQKTLRSYSALLDLNQFNSKNWVTSKKDLWYIDRALDHVPHHKILTAKMAENLRKADPIEIKVGKITEWRIS